MIDWKRAVLWTAGLMAAAVLFACGVSLMFPGFDAARAVSALRSDISRSVSGEDRQIVTQAVVPDTDVRVDLEAAS